MLEANFGPATPLIKQGLIAPTVQYQRHGEGKIAEFNFQDIKDLTNHRFRLQAEQYKLCRILRKILATQGTAQIIYNAEITSLRQDKNMVIVAVNDHQQQLAGRYLVGADGANSIVRRTLKIPFNGFTWPEHFLVVTTSFDSSTAYKDLSSVSYVADPDEWYFLLEIPGGLWRVTFPTCIQGKDEDVLNDKHVQKRLKRGFNKSKPYHVGHKTLYKVHQRVADTYRIGRILLTSDAAHINNPLGGMGMNGGIYDSFNLGRKLVAILKDEVDPAILDQYSSERRYVAMEYFQKYSIQNKKDLEPKDPDSQTAFKKG